MDLSVKVVWDAGELGNGDYFSELRSGFCDGVCTGSLATPLCESPSFLVKL